MERDNIFFGDVIEKNFLEPNYDIVYVSLIFFDEKNPEFQKNREDHIRRQYPESKVIFGGCGSTNPKGTIEELIGFDSYFASYDYSMYENTKYDTGFSYGYLSKGCRNKCSFCVVPNIEGKIVSVAKVPQLFRGSQSLHNKKRYAKKLVIMDNDFFGNPDWKERCEEIIKGKYMVSFNGGINIRKIEDEQVHYLTLIKSHDDSFKSQRMYVAFDNPKDEKLFRRGAELFAKHGLAGEKNGEKVLVYMLINYWNKDIEEAKNRYEVIKEYGFVPYPMLYDDEHASEEFKNFRRWAIRRETRRTCTFDEYKQHGSKAPAMKKMLANQTSLFD